MKPILQILIAAYGEDALERIASLEHPVHDGVEYIVSWQKHDMGRIPENIGERKDFRIYPTDTIGSSINRNEALLKATSDFVLISDDDLAFSEEQLENLLRGIREYPGYDYLTFQYECDDFPKWYPEHSYELDNTPKGAYTSLVEIVLNIRRFKERGGFPADALFNLNFGISGHVFDCGEEDILLAKLKKKGYKGRFIPSYITKHFGPTTSDRWETRREFITTKGACIYYAKPGTWFLRMLIHAWRASKREEGRRVNFVRYCRWWLNGVGKAIRHNVFKDEI